MSWLNPKRSGASKSRGQPSGALWPMASGFCYQRLLSGPGSAAASARENGFVIIFAYNFGKSLVENSKARQAQRLQRELEHEPERLQTVNCAHAKIDPCRFRKITCLNRNLGYFELHVGGLGNHL